MELLQLLGGLGDHGGLLCLAFFVFVEKKKEEERERERERERESEWREKEFNRCFVPIGVWRPEQKGYARPALCLSGHFERLPTARERVMETAKIPQMQSISRERRRERGRGANERRESRSRRQAMARTTTT